MRLMVDTLIALMLAAVLGSIVWYQRHEDGELEHVAAVQESIRTIQGQCAYRVAVGDAEPSKTGFAMHISAAWFEPTPRNGIVDAAVPGAYWLEQAGPDARERFDPASIVADMRTPSFWYNPHKGVVRARVPMQISQQATVDLYNLINGTSLRVDDVAWDAPPPARQYVIDKAYPTRPDAGLPQTVTAPTDPVLRDFGK